MSKLIESEPDDSSDSPDEYGPGSGSHGSHESTTVYSEIQDDSIEEHIPLSTSVMLERLPEQQKQRVGVVQGRIEPSRIINLDEHFRALNPRLEPKESEEPKEPKEPTEPIQAAEESIETHQPDSSVISSTQPKEEPIQSSAEPVELTKSVETQQETQPETPTPHVPTKTSEGSVSVEEKPEEEKVVSSKIQVRLVPIGSTPSLNPRIYQISSHQKISAISHFVSKKLRHKGNVHLYIQSSFQPSPDEKLEDLYQSFKTNTELIISYCFTVAFG